MSKLKKGLSILGKIAGVFGYGSGAIVLQLFSFLMPGDEMTDKFTRLAGWLVYKLIVSTKTEWDDEYAGALLKTIGDDVQRRLRDDGIDARTERRTRAAMMRSRRARP